MNEPGAHKGVIGIRTAVALYALLAAWSLATLKGIALAFALIVIVGLAIKSYVHFLRSRIE
jgi:high-affinity Fe2+/Pb2+ permease